MNTDNDREQKIIRTSIIGIIANILLAAFKATVGTLSNSVAIILDSVNNMSDALSSLITIIGTRLASKEPDRKHPLGHGRIEYLSAVVIGIIVTYAGLTALFQSVKKILTPETPDYSAATLIVVAAAIIVKLVLGRYTGKVGHEVNSDSLVASGKDAISDAILSASTLAAAILFMTTGIRTEPYLAAIISLFIIKAGYDILRETTSEILGERIDAETARNIRSCICEFPEVYGVYDLVVHNYGPNTHVGSAHIEIPDTMTADEIDLLIRRITERVYTLYGIAMTGLSIYSINTRDEDVISIREEVTKLALAEQYVLQLHGFYLNKPERTMRFDLVLDFDAPDKSAICRKIRDNVSALHPEYDIYVTPDYDLADL
ncbi:MAG: cation diffusion facilitator family transporter [Lachnospiraceae bacterium]|nr:cation diffusion facilitator family transporter [Lachnospiraceae bacterium]